MEVNTSNRSPVQEELDERRSDSEVKDILNDIERLKTVPPDRKTRWVWELIQNARDCAVKAIRPEDRFVNIEFIVEPDKLIFTHDTLPFSLSNLVSLVTRTSDKEYISGEGTVSTGKYGNGFVTSHVLNRKVTVSGLLRNKEGGLRSFDLLIDRSFDVPADLRKALNEAYQIIDSFFLSPADNNTEGVLTRYEYGLDEESYPLAESSMEDLRKDLAFVLLINRSIRSVTISYPARNLRHKYETSEPVNVFDNIQFSRLQEGDPSDSEETEGLLHHTHGTTIIAVPVKKEGQCWVLQPLDKEVRLFKELPLIGTEKWHLPYFVQDAAFLPPEPRDGIRTLKLSEDKPDMVADKNRNVLLALKDLSIQFFQSILTAGVEQAYLFAESGLPDEKTAYTSPDWFSKHFQEPLRSFFRTQNLVRTANNKLISIGQAKIPHRFLLSEDNQAFYDIAVKFYGDVFPDDRSFEDWQKILTQDPEAWGVNNFCTVEQLATDISQCRDLTGLAGESKNCGILWLNTFIGFMGRVADHGVSASLSLYPNQMGELKRMQDLRIDPPLNEALKEASKALNMSFLPKLLDRRITHSANIATFETEVNYKALNEAIGKLQPDEQNASRFIQLLSLISLFRFSPARERERWHLLMQQLLPSLVADRQVVTDIDEFSFDSAEFASLRYACWLVQECKTVTAFAAKYFEDNLPAAFQWLNELLETVYRKKDTYAELPFKFNIIPTQDHVFRKAGTGIFTEGEVFDNKLKELYTKYAGEGNALEKLICTEIHNDNLVKTSEKLLADPIDFLFSTSDSEQKVEPGKPLHELFHELNSWLSDQKGTKDILFRFFTSRMPILYVKAYGPGMSKFIMAATKLNWQPEDFDAIQELNLQPADLQKLTQAAKMAGSVQRLLDEAAKIEKDIIKAQWRKKIGTKAESAFKNVIDGLQAYNVTNPDAGFDFEICLGDAPTFLVEIKSTVISKSNVQMSALQGRTARDEFKRYALCVVPREEMDTDVTEEYFKQHARFIVNIGELVKDKVNGIENGLMSIRNLGQDDVASSLDDERYSVYVSTKVWTKGKTYEEFITFLQEYFAYRKLESPTEGEIL